MSTKETGTNGVMPTVPTVPTVPKKNGRKVVGNVWWKGEEVERCRGFFIRTYADEECVKAICQNATNFAYILHDKDGCEPHYHIIFEQRVRPASLLRRIAEIEPTQQTVVEQLKDRKAASKYMLHADIVSRANGKTLYDIEDVITNDIERYFPAPVKNEVADNNFLDDLLAGRLTRREMARRYGRDYMKNYRAYEEFKTAVEIQEREISREAMLNEPIGISARYTIVDLVRGACEHAIRFKQAPCPAQISRMLEDGDLQWLTMKEFDNEEILK